VTAISAAFDLAHSSFEGKKKGWKLLEEPPAEQLERKKYRPD